ncbi:MAG: sodium-dependent transporter, partial [Eubacteriaceae bacterium]|nr:sodium-dependent transporter [Eubacteriaceae bacterium]
MRRTQVKERKGFSGRLGYVLATAGSAVGLGNIWRFPYLAARYGGGAFLLVYIILAMTFGYTMIMSETAIGRMTGKSPVGAFRALGKRKAVTAGG